MGLVPHRTNAPHPYDGADGRFALAPNLETAQSPRDGAAGGRKCVLRPPTVLLVGTARPSHLSLGAKSIAVQSSPRSVPTDSFKLRNIRTSGLIGQSIEQSGSRAWDDEHGIDQEPGSLAWGEIDGRPIIASRKGDRIVLLDARSGKPACPPLVGHPRSMAWGKIDGRPVVVSGERRGYITLWDARTGRMVWNEHVGVEQAGEVSAVTFGAVNGRPVIAWGTKEPRYERGIRAVGLSDARVGGPIGRPIRVHADVVSVAIGEIDEQPSVVSNCKVDRIALWNARTGNFLFGDQPERKD